MDIIHKKTLGIDHNGGAILVRPQVLLLMLCRLLICIKHIVLMLMINILTFMIMMMILIRILQYGLYKILKASFKWVPNLGTSSGHEPIIDRSYGAPIFFGGQSSSRSIRQRPSQGCRMDLRGSYERKTGRVQGPLHHENFEILAKIRFEDMNLQSKAREISWAERGSHRIEKMMVYDRKTE